MRFSLIPTTAVVWSVCATAALAQTQTFKDVPANHWAASAVKEVAVDHHFMSGYPDGTFRGDQPFTRLQLALAVNELISGLEQLTKSSWATQGLGGYEFTDLPKDPETRKTILKLANEYRLFEGVPGVTSRTFEGDKQVDRYEMAKVVDRLMHLGEDKGVVDPAVLKPQVYTFSDVPMSAWDYDAVKEVADRYQVMVGFPNGTFRGPEQLTRYQFASSASQTFPLVTGLVQKTKEQREQKQEAAKAAWRFQESAPVELGVFGRFGNATDYGAAGRFAAYWNSFFLLGQAQADLSVNNYAGDLNVGYAIPLGETSHLQPYIGGRALLAGAASAGLNYGLVAYCRPSDTWGYYAQAQGTSLLGGTGSTFLPMGKLGVEYYFTPGLGLTLEAGYNTWPAAAVAPAPAGGASPVTSMTLGAPELSLGLNF